MTKATVSLLRPIAVALALLVGLAGPALAAALNPRDAALVDRVSAYLNSFRTMQGDFVQVDPNGGRSEGAFAIQRPGRLIFRYNPPVRVEIVADGKAVVIRDRKAGTQDLYSIGQTPLRFFLAEHVDLRRDGKIVGVHDDGRMVTIWLDEATPLGGGRIALIFDSRTLELRQWTVVDAQGQTTSVAVSNLQTGVSLDPRLFYINHQRILD